MKDILRKICSCCNTEKSLLLDFYKGTNKDGRRSWCKSCISDFYQIPENRAKVIERHKENYRKKHKKLVVSKNKENIQKYLFKSAKARAKTRFEEFSLNQEDVIVPEYCPLLGIKMQYNETIKQDNSYSLDRIDSTKGYLANNIWVISLRANRIKNDATIEEFEQILNNWKIKLNM